jgi:anaerobic selenocysteine-containing dehydrogenase
MATWKTSFCRICEAACGVEVCVDNNQITDIRPDPNHVVSKGYVCVKGIRYQEVHRSPDRIRTPIKRVGTQWFPISWPQALSEIGQKIQQLRSTYSPHSVGLFFGNPTAFSLNHPLFSQGFAKALGTRNVFSSGSQDCNNKFAVCERMYGSPMLQPIPDFDNVRCFIIIGSNPAISHMSFLQVPRPIERLRAIEQKGGQVWFVNPRKTESAHQVGTHLPIRANCDVFFLAAFLHELLAQQTATPSDKPSYLRHFKQLTAIQNLVQPWTAERVALVTGIPASTLRDLVTTFRTSSAAAMYCSTGVNQGKFGTLAFWLLNVINALSGNLDRHGGMLVSDGLFPLAKIAKTLGVGHQRFSSRIGNFPAILDTLPASILPDEITTPGKEQLRALFVTAGNPVLSCGDELRFHESFQKLELLVTIDLFRNETGNLAHYVLPALSFFERPDIPLGIHGFQPIPYLQYAPAIVEPTCEEQDEWWIFTQLAQACGVPLFGSRLVDAYFRHQPTLKKLPILGKKIAFDSTTVMALMVRASRQLSWEQLLRNPHGIQLRPNQPHSFLGKRVLTQDGLVDLAPMDLMTLANQQLESGFAEEKANRTRLKLISKRERLMHNSWFHNIESPGQLPPKNHLYLHPDDAKSRQIADGEWVQVATEHACLQVAVKYHPQLMPGTVALPHGWGHKEADGLALAQQAPGVNVNRLLTSGTSPVEKLSGMTQMTGFFVEIQKIAQPSLGTDPNDSPDETSPAFTQQEEVVQAT